MQLKLQRSQRMGGVVGTRVFFCLDVRADYSSEERDNIRKYRLGSEVVYNSRKARKHLDRALDQFNRSQSRDLKEQVAGVTRGIFSLALAKMSLNISIASLGRGHHIECKDLEELLEGEEAVREACKNVTRYLDVAATFDGSEVVIEYENGEERVHITQHAPPLLSYQDTVIDAETEGSGDMGANVDPLKALAAEIKTRWLAFETKLMTLLDGRGWMLNRGQIRVLCAGVSCVVLLFLFELL